MIFLVLYHLNVHGIILQSVVDNTMFWFLTEEAMFSWKKKVRDISVSVLSLDVCVCVCVPDFQRFKLQ